MKKVLNFLVLFALAPVFVRAGLPGRPKPVVVPSVIANVSSEGVFAEKIRGGQYVVVDFHAPWCGACKALAPIIEELAKKWSEEGVEFYKVDTDLMSGWKDDYGIKGIPTLIFYKDGEQVIKTVGFQTKPQIEENLNKLKS